MLPGDKGSNHFKFSATDWGEVTRLEGSSPLLCVHFSIEEGNLA
jgi:hypothetical protein